MLRWRFRCGGVEARGGICLGMGGAFSGVRSGAALALGAPIGARCWKCCVYGLSSSCVEDAAVVAGDCACGVVGAGVGSLFVFKGKYRAVLINYPTMEQRDEIFRDTNVQQYS